MNISLAWDAPVPAPSCGFKVLYRRKADPTYTEYDTSGTTAVIGISAPANYEGNIQSDCCSSIAVGEPFGLNAYVPLNFVASISGSALTFVLSSVYGNPYDVLVNIEVNYHIGSTHSTFTSIRTYTAGSTTSTGTSVVSPGTVIDSYTINAISPVFNNGGQLQQLDPVNTPEYFQFYRYGNLSGTTWNGSPASLPSFTIDSFLETEVASDGTTVLAGNLDISYIVSQVSGSTSVVFDVYDGVILIGTSIIPSGPVGARYVTIALVKGSNLLTNTTAFTMKVSQLDTTLIDSHVFYFP